jgi:hypothetical protein
MITDLLLSNVFGTGTHWLPARAYLPTGKYLSSFFNTTLKKLSLINYWNLQVVLSLCGPPPKSMKPIEQNQPPSISNEQT